MKGFFVTGTDTGVGKTEVAAYLAEYFSRKGLRVGIMKPIATGGSKDAHILGTKPAFSFKLPLAPLVASRIENRKINRRTIKKAFDKAKAGNDIVIIEGIGGIMVPLSGRGRKTFYVLDMISETELPVIIVARPGLGTINHTLMTVGLLRERNIKIEGIILNYSRKVKNDISVKTNPGIIEELSGIKILGIMPYNRKRNKRRVKWSRKTGF